MTNKKNENYEWYEDRPVDIRTRVDSIADSPGLCYHCDNSIPVGSEVTTFGPYRMHTACVEGFLESKNYTHEQVEEMLDAYDMYETARRIDHATAVNMIREADSEEERNFWAYIADMNLQRAQKAAIEQEGARLKPLDFSETLHLSNEKIVISHTEKGTWEDQACPVESFMDTNHLPLKSGGYLDMDDFGKTWVVYLKED